ncbi:MAG: hypothetical protein NVSMB62_18300 [Acidobacteriaceae bacterium]
MRRALASAPRPYLYLVVLAVLLLLSLAAWPFTRAHLQAIAVLRQVAGQPIPPPIARWFAVPVTTRDLTVPIESPSGQQLVRARLYLPGGREDGPAIVIFHGVHHLGIDEPRLTSFASAMARCGIRVLTPELPDIKDYHVGPGSVRTIGESAKWFATHTSTQPASTATTRAQVGVMGLSFSGGLALVAAADPLYHPYIKFVFAVGSQHSMDRVTQYYRTGADIRPDGTVELLPAHEYGPLVLEYEYLDDFIPAPDLGPVRAVLRAHLYEDKAAEAAASLRLNETQQRETLALMDATSTATRNRIAAVIARHTDELAGLSPRGRLHHLSTPVYLLHGEADNIIPAAETLWMASELPSEDLKAMLVSPVLSHIDLDGPSPGPRNQWRLIHFFAQVLHATEQK